MRRVGAVYPDWRHVDANLPFQPEYLHPAKRYAPKNTANLSFRNMGLPLTAGAEEPRAFGGIMTQPGEYLIFDPVSSGRYCSNHGLPFLVEGLFEADECRERCTNAPNCGFFTYYENGWCQLSTRCSREDMAGDPSAVTFAKRIVPASCAFRPARAGCMGDWAAPLGKPLTPKWRRLAAAAGLVATAGRPGSCPSGVDGAC